MTVFTLEKTTEKHFAGDRKEQVYHYVSESSFIAFCAHPQEAFTYIHVDGDATVLEAVTTAFVARGTQQHKFGGFSAAISTLTV